MRKLNVKFAAILSLSVICFFVAVHLLHGVQTNNSAKTLRSSASDLQEKGQLREALKLWSVYTSLRKDDEEAHVIKANLAVDIWESPNPSQGDSGIAMGLMKEAVRNFPGQSKLRRRLLEYNMKRRQWPTAIDHLEYLGADKPDAEPELQIQLAQCYLGNFSTTGAKEDEAKALAIYHTLVGYDAKSKTFDSEKAIDPKNVDAYRQIAGIYLRNQNDLAGRFVDEMIRANPKSAKAYLVLFGYLSSKGKQDEARIAVEKSLEIDPDNAEAILTLAQLDLFAKDFDKAEQHIKHGIDKHPKNEKMYLLSKTLFAYKGDRAQARAAIKRGLTKIPASMKLRWELAKIQLRSQELEEVEKTIKTLKGMHFRTELLDYLKAQITMSQGNVVRASRDFERIRPLLAPHNLTTEVNQLLAGCYAQMRQTDRQLEALLRFVSSNSPAGHQLQLAQAYQALGMNKKASKTYLKIREQLGDNFYKFGFIWEKELAFRIQQQRLERTPDWTAINRLMDGVVAQSDLPDEAIAILRTGVLLRQNKLPEARTQLDATIKAIEQDIADNKLDKKEHLSYKKSLLLNVQLNVQEKNLDEAFRHLADIEKIFGDSLLVRLERAKLLAQRKADKAELALLLETDDENINQDVLEKNLARTYLQLGYVAEARDLLKKVRKRNPYDLPVRITLFELAIQAYEEEEMDEAMDSIEKLCGKTSSRWKYCKARRLFSQAMQTEDRVQLFDEASALLSDIEENGRTQWHARPRLQANIAMAQQDAAVAIKRLGETLELGPADPNITAQLLKLLIAKKQFKEARETLARLKSGQLTTMLRQTSIEIERTDGNQELALAEAKKLMDDLLEKEADTASHHIWYADLLKQFKQEDSAEQAYRRAVEKAPENPGAWLALIRQLVSMRKFLEASDAVREVELALDDDRLPLVLPECYWIIRKTKLAEQLYLESLEANPGNLQLMRALTVLYTTIQDRNSALKYYDQIIQSTASSPSDDAIRSQARREKAKLIGVGDDHQDFVKSLALIKQNYAESKSPSLADLEAEVYILSSRSEFTYKADAIKKILGIRKQRHALPHPMLLKLAQLYDETDKWSDARSAMYRLIGREGNNTNYRMIFTRMFIGHDEHENARIQLDNLDRLAPRSIPVLALHAEADHANGKTAEAINRVKALVPSAQDDASLSDGRIQLLLSIANLYERMDQPDLAEPLYRRYVNIRPNAIIYLPLFLARQGTPKTIDEALDLCNNAKDKLSYSDLLTVGLIAIRSAAALGTPLAAPQMAAIERWFDRAESEDPDSVAIQIRLAELRDAQQRYDEVIVIYRKILAQRALSLQQDPVVRNNLAFQLILSGKGKDEALSLMNDAVKVYGPGSDLLDTRGMVYWSRGETDKALADLKAAIQDGASAEKYFHLALAHQADGNLAEATKQLNTARRLKLDLKTMAVPEREWYEKLATQIDQ